MNVVITAAGVNHKWGGHLGVPSQMIPINGEPLLHRTIRQVHERTSANVAVTVPRLGHFGPLDAYEVVGADDCPMDGVTNNPFTPPTLYLLGDTYFTDAAMDTILACDSAPMFFGRAGASERKVYGELFAALLDADALTMAHALRAVHATMPRCGWWELYRALCGYPLTEHIVGKHFVEIDDETDDFDYPHDYERWLLDTA